MITERKYTYDFSRFLNHTNINPDAIVQKWKKIKWKYPKNQQFVEKYTDIVQNYYAMLCNKKGSAPASANTRITAVLSFFQFHRIPDKHGLDIRKQKNVYVKYHNKDIQREQIRRILEHSNIREKAFYLIMLECGLRPNTICQLKYKHIKEDYEKGIIPMKIDVPAEIVKDRVGNRFTFIGEDGYNALKEYLSTRDTLKDDDYLFVERKDIATRPYLSPETFGNFFSRAVMKLGLVENHKFGKPKPLRLYCLRKYFRNNIKAEDTAYREFWMGHKWGTDEHYLTRDVEKHREVYAEAYPSIRIYEQTPIEVETLRKKLETTEEELKVLRKQVKYLSSPEYIDKRFKELMKEFMEKVKKENPETE